MVSAIFIFLVTVVAILVPAVYLRRQRQQCRKYPFFRLRDQLTMAMVNVDDPMSLCESYWRVNFVIEKLNDFDLDFFMDVMIRTIEGVIREPYEKAIQKKESRMDLNLNQYDIRLLSLLVESARSNSLLLLIAMTRFGLLLLFPPAFIRGVLHLILNYWPRMQFRVRALKGYGLLAQSDLATA